ncbi:FAD-binding domain-containing protein [Ephemerocybe angulata]|uniref:FAD-binding domain-containing protein n=1 Tax=Ephemerocybe angulata TaxID=980116 RepID=A0A8H6I098_9AGAR|nr:FAD-binding domain-containing protein [Tulosesus angulatus]
MRASLLLFSGIPLALAVSTSHSNSNEGYASVCAHIASDISSGSVYYPGSTQYEEMTHRYALSAGENSTCAVGPKTSWDVGRILRVVGSTRTPFAVQSGGHAQHRGFSSTRGVHISLRNFRSIVYNSTAKIVTIGTGLVWDEVYEALDPHGVSVAGGRVAGVGVGGLTLGGGNVTALELVKPNGEVVQVTEEGQPDLFFALRGGLNNFGIVTAITLKVFPQGPVWGGAIVYSDPAYFSKVAAATSRFTSQVTDPKANLLRGYSFSNGLVVQTAIILYDAPSPPPGVFDDFLKIPSIQNTITTQSFLSFFTKSSAGVPDVVPGIYVCSANFLQYLYYLLQASFKSSRLSFGTGITSKSKSLTFLGFTPEPFLSTILSHNTTPSAYPFTRSTAYCPMALSVGWADPADEAFFSGALKQITRSIEAALVAEGHGDVTAAPLYPNYAFGDTPVSRIYGSNLARMTEIKGRVDPKDVMGLTGGFKL